MNFALLFFKPTTRYISCTVLTQFSKCSKWFEPRSISSLSGEIVRVGVVLKRTVGGSD